MATFNAYNCTKRRENSGSLMAVKERQRAFLRSNYRIFLAPEGFTRLD
jgi:hypothetical protein